MPVNVKTVEKLLSDMAYVRTGGSAEEHACAAYLAARCADLGLSPQIETFPVPMYHTERAQLTVNGREIPCTPWGGTANGTFTGKIYCPDTPDDSLCLKKCRGKIVLTEAALTWKRHDAFAAHGAVAVLTCNGDIRSPERDVDVRERRFDTENPLPVANIHMTDALELAKKGGDAVLTLSQTVSQGLSPNVIVDLPGETAETVLVSAHYDSTALSRGAYDNLTGAIGLLYLAEYFRSRPHRRTIRLLFCGSEERGLLGSIAYCGMHREELQHITLNINLDMLGSVMGGFAAFSCVDEDLRVFLERFLKRHRFPGAARYAIRSTDSNSFLYCGVPAMTFARYAPAGTAPIHTRYDTPDAVSAKKLLADMGIIAKFAAYAANEPNLRYEISDKIRQDVTEYMARKTAIRDLGRP